MSRRVDPALTTQLDVTRVPPASIQIARALSTATLHEAANKSGALPSAIKPTSNGFRLCGSALTVQSPGGDNLWLHRALDIAQPEDVLVVHVGGQYHHGYWGEIMSTAARVRRLGGLVIDGCVRDAELLEKIGFPVFARGLCIRGTGKDFGARGWINAPVLFEDVVISPGDLIVGDEDGVVCVAHARIDGVLAQARERDRLEEHILRRIEAGESTLDVYGWR